jgi:hypothetical protein
MEARAKLVLAGSAENKRFPDESRLETQSRDDLSPRMLVDAGPSTEPKSEPSIEVPTTLLEDLSTVIARAVREGGMPLARALLDAAVWLTAPPTTTDSNVVDIATARRKAVTS